MNLIKAIWLEAFHQRTTEGLQSIGQRFVGWDEHTRKVTFDALLRRYPGVFGV